MLRNDQRHAEWICDFEPQQHIHRYMLRRDIRVHVFKVHALKTNRRHLDIRLWAGTSRKEIRDNND